MSNPANADETTCPMCGYDLRGQVGDLVNCPECGQYVNVKLARELQIDNRYWGSQTAWHGAPGCLSLIGAVSVLITYVHLNAWAALVLAIALSLLVGMITASVWSDLPPRHRF